MQFFRTFSFSRLIAVAAAGFALSACGGGGASTPTVYNGNAGPFTCNPGTQVQTANPQPGQANVPTNIGSIVIVASDQNNVLYNTYQQWNLVLTDNAGNQLTSGQLNLVPFKNGPQPYASDFYYSASIPGLIGGRTYNVQLNQNTTQCTPLQLNSFFT